MSPPPTLVVTWQKKAFHPLLQYEHEMNRRKGMTFERDISFPIE